MHICYNINTHIMKHLFILLFLCQGILAQAQTRLSKMPWHERDSVITAILIRKVSHSYIRVISTMVTWNGYITFIILKKRTVC